MSSEKTRMPEVNRKYLAISQGLKKAKPKRNKKKTISGSSEISDNGRPVFRNGDGRWVVNPDYITQINQNRSVTAIYNMSGAAEGLVPNNDNSIHISMRVPSTYTVVPSLLVHQDAEVRFGSSQVRFLIVEVVQSISEENPGVNEMYIQGLMR